MMKWYEVMEDCGDGTTTAHRFKTRKEAQKWRRKKEKDPDFLQDGDGSPVIEVDTDSPWFFHTED